MTLHHALRRTTALAGVTLTAGLVSAAALAAGRNLRGLAGLGLLVCLAAAAIGLDLAVRALAVAEHRLADLTVECDAVRLASLTDPLTGLGNRRHFDQRLTDAVVAALRYGEPFSVAVFDLDDFKSINDRHGHAAGDAALLHVARLLRAGTRDADLVCRWGGEEFAVLFPRTGQAGAARVAERILGALRAKDVDVDVCSVALTASAGVSAFPYDGVDGPSVVGAADVALLRAKSLGKDRVERAWSSGGATVAVDLTGRDRAGIPAGMPHALA
jgi:diguanylate cyclase (GGDEF)-like protein